MKNFEQISINTVKNNKLNREVSNFIFNKINSVALPLRGSGFNLNNPSFLKKIDKLNDGIREEFFSNDENIENTEIKKIEREIFKIVLEELAKNDFGGSLSMYEDLENKYLEILAEEALLEIKNDYNSSDFHDSSFIKDLCDKLNKKNILDNDKKGRLFNRIKDLINIEKLNKVA